MREKFTLNHKNLLGLIIKTRNELQDGENMDKIRNYFEDGETVGQQFVELLYDLQKKGLIKGVQFIPDNDPHPEEAVWSNVQITSLGLQMFKTMNR
jgi:hypothetical protein